MVLGSEAVAVGAAAPVVVAAGPGAAACGRAAVVRGLEAWEAQASTARHRSAGQAAGRARVADPASALGPATVPGQAAAPMSAADLEAARRLVVGPTSAADRELAAAPGWVAVQVYHSSLPRPVSAVGLGLAVGQTSVAGPAVARASLDGLALVTATESRLYHRQGRMWVAVLESVEGLGWAAPSVLGRSVARLRTVWETGLVPCLAWGIRGLAPAIA